MPPGKKELMLPQGTTSTFFPLGDNHAPKEERTYVVSGSNFNFFPPRETIMPPGKDLMLP